MKKVLINGLLIDNKSTGIGNYGYNLVSKIGKINTDYNISALIQKDIDIKNIEVVNKKYNSSLKRILSEQLVLPKTYKDYELIHFIDYSSPILEINKPFIITIHDLSFYKYPHAFTYGSRKIKEIIAPISVKRASRIIVDSNNTKKDLVEVFDIDESKVRIVYPGRPDYEKIKDKFKIQKVKEKYNIEGDYILYLGTLEPRKNIIRLVEVYNKLVKEGITEKLVIAGKKGWLYKDIFNKVKQLALDERVIFTDYVEEKDKPLLYSGAKVFVYVSLYEGFGLPPLEAMTCSIPVVVSKKSSLPEVVGDSGIYVNSEDIDSIAKGIYSIIKNKDLREKLGFQGKERSKKFNWENTAKQVLSIYDELMG
ncbi:glycosyltransferase family 4 protein [Thermohalobacter berrensis]|uniref:Glycosyl transferase family 1 n=1 Tax=Thermohalobacter berrensis TaxID=99594 RepID=A0A419T402_9FIRM|nr:glycosyltransferase family 1 protein [Thermohalobacter berrensis]RKD32280.1 hypothetical protein BET03_02920 [Thermohalobacter berrensis]